MSLLVVVGFIHRDLKLGNTFMLITVLNSQCVSFIWENDTRMSGYNLMRNNPLLRSYSLICNMYMLTLHACTNVPFSSTRTWTPFHHPRLKLDVLKQIVPKVKKVVHRCLKHQSTKK